MTDLFDIPESPSPRLKWMRENKCITWNTNSHGEWYPWLACFDVGRWKHESTADFFFQETGCNGESNCGTGSTEDEAIIDLCLKSGVKHWSVL